MTLALVDPIPTVGTPMYDAVCAELQANPLGGPIPPKPKPEKPERPRDEHGRFIKEAE